MSNVRSRAPWSWSARHEPAALSTQRTPHLQPISHLQAVAQHVPLVYNQSQPMHLQRSHFYRPCRWLSGTSAFCQAGSKTRRITQKSTSRDKCLVLLRELQKLKALNTMICNALAIAERVVFNCNVPLEWSTCCLNEARINDVGYRVRTTATPTAKALLLRGSESLTCRNGEDARLPLSAQVELSCGIVVMTCNGQNLALLPSSVN